MAAARCTILPHFPLSWLFSEYRALYSDIWNRFLFLTCRFSKTKAHHSLYSLELSISNKMLNFSKQLVLLLFVYLQSKPEYFMMYYTSILLVFYYRKIQMLVQLLVCLNCDSKVNYYIYLTSYRNLLILICILCESIQFPFFFLYFFKKI